MVISLMRDLVKITNARDLKELKSYEETVKAMQQEGNWPISYEFPLTLQFELTRNCNLRCRHCYNDSGIQVFQDEMTPEKWKNFARYLVAHGGVFQCILSGGEPLLLNDDLFDIMDILHDDGTSFLLITNGMLLTEEKVKRLSKYRFMWLQVSIDGATADIHDSFRGIKGSWENAVKGAYQVSKYGIPLTIAHSITPYSLDSLDEMCELAYQLGAGTILVGEITPSGRSFQNQDILLNYEQKNILLEGIERNNRKYRGKMSIERSANPKMQLMRYQKSLNGGAIIRPNGDIRLDCMAPFIIGNILTDDFATIWKEKSGTCWLDEKVNAYIEQMDEITGMDTMTSNYIDKDILL